MIYFVKKVCKAIKTRGIWSVVTFLIKRPSYFYDKFLDFQFEKKYQIDTKQIIPLTEYDMTKTALQDANYYEGISVSFYKKMIRHIPLPMNDYTFIDLGSGKGKALILATEDSFKNVIGVEFSPPIHAIAQSNIARYKKISQNSTQISLYCQNAQDFKFPKENIIIFLYNPFSGQLLDEVLTNIEQHIVQNKDRKIFILYRNPKCSEQLKNRKHIKTIFQDNHYMVCQGH